MNNKVTYNFMFILMFSGFPLFMLLGAYFELDSLNYYKYVIPIITLTIVLQFLLFEFTKSTNRKNLRLWNIIILFSFIIYVGLISLNSINKSIYLHGLFETLYTCAIAFVCAWIGSRIKDLNVISSITVPMLTSFLLFALLLLNFSIIEISAQLFSYTENVETAYQSIARNLFILILAYVVTERKRTNLNYILIILTLFVIFILGSRTYFVLSTILFFTLSPKRGLLITMFAVTFFWDYLALFRVGELLSLQNSESYNERIQLREAVLLDIDKNVFLGNFFDYKNTLNSYDHGIFSAWQNYGFIGFVLYLGTLCVIPIYWLSRKHMTSSLPFWGAYLSVTVLCVGSEPLMLNMTFFFVIGLVFARQNYRSDVNVWN